MCSDMTVFELSRGPQDGGKVTGVYIEGKIMATDIYTSGVPCEDAYVSWGRARSIRFPIRYNLIAGRFVYVPRTRALGEMR